MNETGAVVVRCVFCRRSAKVFPLATVASSLGPHHNHAWECRDGSLEWAKGDWRDPNGTGWRCKDGCAPVPAGGPQQ